MNMRELRDKSPVSWMVMTSVLMGLNIVLSSISIPVPGGHFYLNDIVIVIASILLDPIGAFVVGGVGAFLGDFFFYPAPMFVSLLTHGLQAFTISYFTRKIPDETGFKGSLLGVSLGFIIMVVGYTLGRTFVYSTYEYAIIKLPFECLQAGVGAIVGMTLTYKGHLRNLYIQKFHLNKMKKV